MNLKESKSKSLKLYSCISILYPVLFIFLPDSLDLTWQVVIVKHQKILPRSNTQLYYNNGGHNNNLKTLRRFHDVDDVTVKDNQ